MNRANTPKDWKSIAQSALPSAGWRMGRGLAAGRPRRPYLARLPLFGETSDEIEQASADPQLRSPRLARLEAALFAANAPLNSRRLAQAATLADATEARTLVRQLNTLYELGQSAFRVESVAGGFQLLTCPEFSRWLSKLFQSRPGERLSRPALETLAIVAYRQPVLRADVEAIRGVECGEMLRQLMEKDFVRIAGRDQALGRPILYGTTKKFLMVFGLKSLDELPRAEQLRQQPKPAEPAEELEPNEPEEATVSPAETESSDATEA